MDFDAKILDSFAGTSLLVLGDMVADEYVTGVTSRISREAPVLIVKETGREQRPGGAARHDYRGTKGNPTGAGSYIPERQDSNLI